MSDALDKAGFHNRHDVTEYSKNVKRESGRLQPGKGGSRTVIDSKRNRKREA
jgi:hypothetical protein